MAIIYKGTVKSTATPYLIARDSPAGEEIGKLYPNEPIEGAGELVFENGYWRMELSAPIHCWAASMFLDYDTEIVSDPQPQEPQEPQEPEREIFLMLVPGGRLYKYVLVEE